MQPLVYRRSVGFGVPSSGRECRCFISRAEATRREKGRSKGLLQINFCRDAFQPVFNSDTAAAGTDFIFHRALARSTLAPVIICPVNLRFLNLLSCPLWVTTERLPPDGRDLGSGRQPWTFLRPRLSTFRASALGIFALNEGNEILIVDGGECSLITPDISICPYLDQSTPGTLPPPSNSIQVKLNLVA